MKDYSAEYESKKITVEEALAKIESDMNIYVGVDAAEPAVVLREMYTVCDKVKNVTVNSVLGPEDYRHFHDESGNIRTEPFFYGPHTRRAHSLGNVSLVPASISTLYRDRAAYRKPNIFIGLASPMDKHGFMTMGMCISQEMDALEEADIVILEVNPNVPVVYGDAAVHIKNVDFVVESDRELPCASVPEPNEIQKIIGRNVADLIEDGSTIQLGIGGIPDAAASQLMNKHDLGVHSEMFTPSMVKLYEAGVITGAKKNIDKGKMVCALLTSAPEVLEFVDHNPAVKIMRGTYVNDPFVIMKNDKMVAVNSALHVDLTGQIFAETIGHTQYSGSGGANDFAMGAHRSRGGKSIIALPSTKKKGTVSAIQPLDFDGGVVTVLRQTVDYVVTEYGAAPLSGRSIKDRVENLIAVAHPDFRAELREQAKKLQLW